MSNISKSILQGAKEALDFSRGEKNKHTRVHKVKLPEQIDVSAIRVALHMTRSEFAARFGFSVRTLEKWEQGVRKPDTSARAYLLLIEHRPKVVEAVLQKYLK